MIRKVKNWFGIEGLRLNLEVNEDSKLNDDVLKGRINVVAKKDETITFLALRLIEKYARGRRKSKLIDEYIMGVSTIEEPIFISPEEPFDFEFELPFRTEQSEMDELENKNIVLKGLVKTAKWLKGVRSTYRLEAEAKVKGQALRTTATLEVKFK